MSNSDDGDLPPLEDEPSPRLSAFPSIPAEFGVIPKRKVIVLRFASYEQRLRSFSNWPRHMNQSPKELSLAGFFYTGRSDRVQVKPSFSTLKC